MDKKTILLGRFLALKAKYPSVGEKYSPSVDDSYEHLLAQYNRFRLDIIASV